MGEHLLRKLIEHDYWPWSPSALDDVLRPIVAVTIINPISRRKELVYAILDSGADRDYVSIDLARHLGLELEQREMELAIKDTTSWGERNLLSVKLGNLAGSYEADVDDVINGGFATGMNKIPPAKKIMGGIFPPERHKCRRRSTTEY